MSLIWGLEFPHMNLRRATNIQIIAILKHLWISDLPEIQIHWRHRVQKTISGWSCCIRSKPLYGPEGCAGKRGMAFRLQQTLLAAPASGEQYRCQKKFPHWELGFWNSRGNNDPWKSWKMSSSKQMRPELHIGLGLQDHSRLIQRFWREGFRTNLNFAVRQPVGFFLALYWTST